MRLLHRLDFKGLDIVKGINLEGLRPIGKIDAILEAWSQEALQEIYFQGAATSLHNTNLDLTVVSETRRQYACPLVVGGGVKNLSDAKKMIKHGADRIAINSTLFTDHDLLARLVNQLGASTVVVSIDVAYLQDDFYCFVHNGRENSRVSLSEHLANIKNVEEVEIIVTDIDKDGTCRGVNNKLLSLLEDYPGPIIYSGGISTLDDIALIQNSLSNPSSGIAVGRAFHNFLLKSGYALGEPVAFASKFELGRNSLAKMPSLNPIDIINRLEKNRQ